MCYAYPNAMNPNSRAIDIHTTTYWKQVYHKLISSNIQNYKSTNKAQQIHAAASRKRERDRLRERS